MTKQTPQLKQIEKELRAGGHHELANDRRTLTDILAADQQAVDSAGSTHTAIAERLQLLRDCGLNGLGDPVECQFFNTNYIVKVDLFRGKLPCLFGHKGLYRKSNIIVKNAENQQISYSDLRIHQIDEHGFYGGKGSPYRLEPAELVGFLGISQ